MVRHKYLQQSGDERRESFKTFLRKELGIKPQKKQKPTAAPKPRVVKKKEAKIPRRRAPQRKLKKFTLFPGKKQNRQVLVLPKPCADALIETL